jgi:hypothetical protein
MRKELNAHQIRCEWHYCKQYSIIGTGIKWEYGKQPSGCKVCKPYFEEEIHAKYARV